MKIMIWFILTFSEVVGKSVILIMINVYLLTNVNIALLFSCMEAALTPGGNKSCPGRKASRGDQISNGLQQHKDTQ